MEGESISGLLGEERDTTTCLGDGDAVTECSYGDYSDRDDEYVEMLFQKEISFGFQRDQFLAFDNWVKSARLEAISWILKVSIFVTCF